MDRAYANVALRLAAAVIAFFAGRALAVTILSLLLGLNIVVIVLGFCAGVALAVVTYQMVDPVRASRFGSGLRWSPFTGIIGSASGAAIVAFVIALWVIFSVAELLFGSGIFGVIVSLFVGLFGAGLVAKTVFENAPVAAGTVGGSTREIAKARGAEQILIFGHPQHRPALLDTATGLFNRKPSKAWYMGRDGQVHATGIPPLGRTPLNERRMFESLIESARYERAKRGHPLKSRLNRAIHPTVYNEGILIEELPNEDGSVSLILAVGLGSALGRDEWHQAYSHGIGRYKSAWDEKPYANINQIRHGWGDVEKLARPRAGIFPLFEVELTEIVIPGEKIEERHGEQVALEIPDEWQ